ncbi:rod-binding protein [Maritimibacter sp. DP1N21-5]|uniref:rod-binding protein n=1 Tax=Maritimibacter sp. DP1N21-5 TaxID=2836867 RepID=UPI001C475C04|nr:rod-binding protein [Maritimibacter sp. DP1N21-5]MBV7407966.1 rod-binding protein [Maritimibacter sp. DP1N21-5]
MQISAPTLPIEPSLRTVDQSAVATDDRLRAVAKDLEATFLAEMLKSAGLGGLPETFGGGAGEEQFASFLRAEQARMMVDAGGIGLSEMLFDALKERADGIL